jgi:hypothetical protein
MNSFAFTTFWILPPNIVHFSLTEDVTNRSSRCAIGEPGVQHKFVVELKPFSWTESYLIYKRKARDVAANHSNSEKQVPTCGR